MHASRFAVARAGKKRPASARRLDISEYADMRRTNVNSSASTPSSSPRHQDANYTSEASTPKAAGQLKPGIKDAELSEHSEPAKLRGEQFAGGEAAGGLGPPF
jgi:hypothetical protein